MYKSLLQHQKNLSLPPDLQFQFMNTFSNVREKSRRIPMNTKLVALAI